MDNCLPDHLPLLIVKNFLHRSIGLVNVGGIGNHNDALWRHRPLEEISADDGFDEAVINSQVLREMKPPRHMRDVAFREQG